jgi:hypothetical protein
MVSATTATIAAVVILVVVIGRQRPKQKCRRGGQHKHGAFHPNLSKCASGLAPMVDAS